MGRPPGAPVSAWWALLLIPIGLLAGWGIAALPTSGLAPPPAPDAPPAVAPVPAASTAEPISRPSHDAQAPPSRPAEPRAELSSWTTSYETAVAESRRNGKPVLIDFSADWCPPCQRMKQSVFDNSAHGRAVQSAVIPVSIVDRRREEGKNSVEVAMLQDRYAVDAFPTLIVINPATGRYERTKGFGGPEATVQWITHAAEAVR